MFFCIKISLLKFQDIMITHTLSVFGTLMFQYIARLPLKSIKNNNYFIVIDGKT